MVETSRFMFTSIILLIPISILLIVAITLIAAKKRLNTILWLVMSIIGFLILFMAIPVLSREAYYHLRVGAVANVIMIINGLSPLLYLFTLLFIVSLKKGRIAQTVYDKCHSCSGVIKVNMEYCPYCGNEINRVETQHHTKKERY